MAQVGVELETFVSEPDALTTRPLPCANNVKHISRKCHLTITIQTVTMKFDLKRFYNFFFLFFGNLYVKTQCFVVNVWFEL